MEQLPIDISNLDKATVHAAVKKQAEAIQDRLTWEKQGFPDRTPEQIRAFGARQVEEIKNGKDYFLVKDKEQEAFDSYMKAVSAKQAADEMAGRAAHAEADRLAQEANLAAQEANLAAQEVNFATPAEADLLVHQANLAVQEANVAAQKANQAAQKAHQDGQEARCGCKQEDDSA